MTSKPNAAEAGTIDVGGDLTVNRLGFGAMRITGQGIWGEPPDLGQAKAAIKRAVELGVNFIDTAGLLRSVRQRDADRRDPVPVSGRPCDREQGRPGPARAGPLGTRTGVPSICVRRSKAA